jgi:hypothetical protein
VATTFTFDVALDFPGGKCNLVTLAKEIGRSASITIALADGGVGSSGSVPVDDVVSAGVVALVFKTDLPQVDETALAGGAGQPYGTHPAGGLIAAHDNTPTPLPVQPVVVKATAPVVVQQQQRSNGHYRILPLVILNIAAGMTKYNEIVVQDYPNGMDWHNAHFFTGDSDSGDQIATAKLLVGKIAVVGQPAAQGDTKVTLVGPAYVLNTTALGGALDEGFYLSFGTENSDLATINGVQGGPPGTGDLSNPEGELREYEIYTVGTPTPIGGGNVAVEITLFSALAAEVGQGVDANLVSRGVPEPLPLTKGDRIDIGGDVLSSGNMPAGSKLRFGYQNNGQATKSMRGHLTVLY